MFDDDIKLAVAENKYESISLIQEKISWIQKEVEELKLRIANIYKDPPQFQHRNERMAKSRLKQKLERIDLLRAIINFREKKLPGGIYGSQTQSALKDFKSNHNCN